MQALEHHVEDRRREVTRRQADQGDGAAAARHADGLAEGAVGYRGDQHPVGAADVALEHLHRVFLPGVDRQAGTELARQFQLGVVDVDGGDVQAHGPGVLHGDVAEAADAGDRHPLAGARVGLLEPLVDGDAGAEDRRDFSEFDVFRQNSDVVRVGQYVFGIAAVHRVAGVLLALAEGLPAGQAVLAAAAGGVQPGDADPVAFLHSGHSAAHRGDVADAFVTGNERQRRLHRPVALGGMQVGVADAGGFDLHQYLPGAGQRNLDFLDPQRRAVGVHDRGFHGLWQGHGHLLGRG